MENFELDLKLTVAQVNVILKYLGNGPYSEVADLIGVLHAQAKPQVEQAAAGGLGSAAEETQDAGPPTAS